jgi:mxaA protein
MRGWIPLPALLVVMIAASVRADSPADLDVAAPTNAPVEQPRSFGYVVGDVLTQRVLLQLNGRSFAPAALPRAERISAWLERRSPSIESTADGRRWLTVAYQVINAPQALTLIRIPAWSVKATSGTDVLTIGEWPISVSPLTPRASFGNGALVELRPDRSAPSIATEPMRRQIAVWTAALVLTLVAWSGWVLWRNWRAAATLPFARAQREMRGLDERAPEAWQALHRAFDRTAGRVTQTATLNDLFRRAPQLTPMRSQIERFFAQSSERFFGAGLPSEMQSVRELCASLRRIERKHER